MSEKNTTTLVAILPILLLQQILGAFTFPIAKVGLDIIEPFAFAFYRFLFSSIALLLITRFYRKTPKIERKDRWRIVGLGLIIIPFNQVLYLYGQSLTGVGHGSLLFATTPVFIFLAALIHLKEKLVVRRMIGIILAVIGVFVIMGGGAITISTDYLIGDLIILLAVMAWAYYTVLGKPMVQKYGAIRVTAYALASGSAIYFPFGLYAALRVDYSAVTTAGWLSVLYLALGTSVAAYVLWYWILKQMAASRIAVFHNIQPIVASVVAWVWLDEQLGLSFIVGGLIVLSGVILAEIELKRPKAAA